MFNKEDNLGLSLLFIGFCFMFFSIIWTLIAGGVATYILVRNHVRGGRIIRKNYERDVYRSYVKINEERYFLIGMEGIEYIVDNLRGDQRRVPRITPLHFVPDKYIEGVQTVCEEKFGPVESRRKDPRI